MIYNEIYKNLFTVDKKYTLAHAISLDSNMGQGIAVDFNKHFKGMKTYLINYITYNDTTIPDVIMYDKKEQKVFNLITKKKCTGKPNYNTIGCCIEKMAKMCKENNIKFLAMPKIGCGLDRLQWGEIREMIKDYFSDLDIEILICKYK